MLASLGLPPDVDADSVSDHTAPGVSVAPPAPEDIDAPCPAPQRPGIRLSFRISASWYGPGGSSTEGVVAGIDAGDAGWWLEGPEGSELIPVTATTIFRRLSALLPKDIELG